MEPNWQDLAVKKTLTVDDFHISLAKNFLTERLEKSKKSAQEIAETNPFKIDLEEIVTRSGTILVKNPDGSDYLKLRGVKINYSQTDKILKMRVSKIVLQSVGSIENFPWIVSRTDSNPN